MSSLAQVPLGARYDAVLALEHRFSPTDAKREADALLATLVPTGGGGRREEGGPRRANLVVDLTNSGRYYDPKTWLELGVRYIKVG